MFEPIKLVGYQFVSTFLFGVYKFYFSLIDHRLQSSIFKYNKKKFTHGTPGLMVVRNLSSGTQ